MHNPPHPGELIRDFYLEPLDLTITEAAKGLGVSRNTLSELINGKNGILPEMAYRLSKAFGRTPESWMNLQTLYDLAQVREKAEKLEVRTFFEPALQPVTRLLLCSLPFARSTAPRWNAAPTLRILCFA